jgi:hypothetical protein
MVHVYTMVTFKIVERFSIGLKLIKASSFLYVPVYFNLGNVYSKGIIQGGKENCIESIEIKTAPIITKIFLEFFRMDF